MLEDLLAGATSPVMVQGATGRAAQQHMRLMARYGTPIVAGVSPTATVAEQGGVPLFRSCDEAARATGARISVIMVPPLALLAAIEDAVAAGVRLIVSVTEGVPVHDAIKARCLVRAQGVDWIGPSTPGLALPGRLKLGFLPDVALAPGPLGVMSRSGTLSYEIGRRLVRRGIGQSAWIGVGGDVVKGTRFADLVPLFQAHPATRALLVIGEIGGTDEEDLALALAAGGFERPVYVVLAGSHAPEGVTMGHAGALVHGGQGSLASKSAALRAAGAEVFTVMAEAVARIERDFGGMP
jgi:succinyl-CoA synthetase alpha subunit